MTTGIGRAMRMLSLMSVSTLSSYRQNLEESSALDNDTPVNTLIYDPFKNETISTQKFIDGNSQIIRF